MSREELEKRILEARYNLVSSKDKETIDILEELAIKTLEQESNREIEDYENEIEDLHNRLDIAEYDKERLREEVTNLEAKIKALEQEPILDKIRAEIEELRLHKAQFLTSDNKVCIDSREVLDIIDKYRKEN